MLGLGLANVGLTRVQQQTDTVAIFRAIKEGGADGIILWGASEDVSSRNKCAMFRQYVLDTLGPAAATVIERGDGRSGASGGRRRTSVPIAFVLLFFFVSFKFRCRISFSVIG